MGWVFGSHSVVFYKKKEPHKGLCTRMVSEANNEVMRSPGRSTLLSRVAGATYKIISNRDQKEVTQQPHADI